MQILFLIPQFLSGRSFLQPPIDVLICSKLIKEKIEDAQIHFLDNRIEKLKTYELCEKIGRIEPDIIVISTSPYDISQNYFIDFRIYAAQKTIISLSNNFPKSLLIVTGPHGTVRPDILLKDTNFSIDIIIRNEYEIIFLEIIKRIYKIFNRGISKKILYKLLKDIPNLILCFNNKERKVKTTRNLDPHLMKVPINLDLSLISKYKNSYFGDSFTTRNKFIRVKPWGVLLLHRGCIYNCKFCFKFLGSKCRIPQDDNEVHSAIRSWLKIGVKNLFILDYDFTMNMEELSRMAEIFSIYKLNIHAQTRCDHITNKKANLLKEIGINFIWLGIESFSPQILQKINKYYNFDSIRSAIIQLKNHEIQVGAFLQFGLPGESIKTLQQTLDSIYKYSLNYTKSIIIHTPLYGTQFYPQAKKDFPWIGKNWSDLASIRGLVDNEMNPTTLIKIVKLLRSRNLARSDESLNLEKKLEQ